MKTETLSKTEYLQTLLHNPTVVGLTIIEYLEPMAGAGRKIQPATYAPERKGDPSRYNINKSNVATIDSVQSQANRLEPIFTQPPYSALVPQIVIEQDGHPPVNLLEVGHRFVDAVVRYANAPEIRAVLDALKGGNFTALAKLNPTAIILGFDDRSFSSLKQPRSLVSEIEAKVEAEYTRFTQYNSSASDALKEAAQELIDSGEASERKVSEFNLDDVPNENLCWLSLKWRRGAFR